MTNLIDRMDQLAEALKAAGDDIASRRVANARRDRIRGLITPAAADAAASTAEKRLVELGQEKARVPNSLLGTITPAVLADARKPGAAMGQAISEAEDRRSKADAMRDLGEKLGGVKVIIADELPGPRPFGQRGFVLRQGDPIVPTLPARETAYTHESGEFDYEWWHVPDDPSVYEYRIPNTGMTVREEPVKNYGACYSFRCATCDALPGALSYSGHPAQVGAVRRLADAWEHWKAKHMDPRRAAGVSMEIGPHADDGYLLNGAPHGIEAALDEPFSAKAWADRQAEVPRREPPRKTTTTTVVHHPFRFRAEPYSGGGWHRPGLTFAELRRIVDELDRARMPDDHFIEVKTTDDFGHRPELLLTPGTWKVEQ